MIMRTKRGSLLLISEEAHYNLHHTEQQALEREGGGGAIFLYRDFSLEKTAIYIFCNKTFKDKHKHERKR